MMRVDVKTAEGSNKKYSRNGGGEVDEEGIIEMGRISREQMIFNIR